MTVDNHPPPTGVIPTSDCHDCGGRCVLKAHVSEGQILKFETDSGDLPQYRACAKGRAYRQMVYAPERLLHPLKRRGRRGSGDFRRISWAEALDSVASKLRSTKEIHGSRSILLATGSGTLGAVYGGGDPVRRLLNALGGCTTTWGSASAEGSRFSSRATFGTLATAHSRDDLLNSRLIIMWGWNPAVSLHGVNTKLHLARAREHGARIIAVDPRYSPSAALFADVWLPVRPGTDTAVMMAMAYIMVIEGMVDMSFINRCTTGFEDFRKYITGIEDGVPKTPRWAEVISGLSAAEIENLAKAYATTKPAALMTGFAPGRTAIGEQFHRAASTLAAITGNIGIPGGNSAGHGLQPGFRLPSLGNPLEAASPDIDESLDTRYKSRHRVHGTQLWDALIRGTSGGYPADFKFLYVAGSNCLNQFLNTRRGVEALQRPDFVVVQDVYLSATARYADIILPAAGHMEREDIYRPLYPEPYYVYLNQAIEPRGEAKSDVVIARELAKRLGVELYREQSEDGLLADVCRLPGIASDLPDYTAFRNDGIKKVCLKEPMVAFRNQVTDPDQHPFPTPSGKIEIYSQRLAALNNPQIPPIPKYITPWEGSDDMAARKYPLQLITTHSWRRANSTFDKVPWLKELDPQSLSISKTDAAVRGIIDGDPIRVFNDRGEIRISARVTELIMPGVVEVPQGAWLDLDEKGVDHGGCANVLTRDERSPGGAYPFNTCLVEVNHI